MSTTAKHTSGTLMASWMPPASEIAPMAAVKMAPPMMAMTSSAAPSLRSESPRPSTPAAKIVGNMMDMKKLLATSA